MTKFKLSDKHGTQLSAAYYRGHYFRVGIGVPHTYSFRMSQLTRAQLAEFGLACLSIANQTKRTEEE